MAPSPITAITLRSGSCPAALACSSWATAMPRPAEMEVDECAAPNGSYSLSRAPGEAGQPAGLAQRADAVAPAGEDLVRVGLVADVPDQPVARGVEHRVQRHGQLHHAQVRTQVPARDRHRVDQLRPKLVRHQPKLLPRQVAKIRGETNTVEMRRGGAGGGAHARTSKRPHLVDCVTVHVLPRRAWPARLFAIPAGHPTGRRRAVPTGGPPVPLAATGGGPPNGRQPDPG